MPAVDSHFIFDVVSSVCGVAWIIVCLLYQKQGAEIKSALGEIKLNQEVVKADLLANQTEIKEQLDQKYDESKEELQRKHLELLGANYVIKQDFDAKHAENRRNIDVHTAQDNEKFEGISRALARIDAKLDRINGFSK